MEPDCSQRVCVLLTLNDEDILAEGYGFYDAGKSVKDMADTLEIPCSAARPVGSPEAKALWEIPNLLKEGRSLLVLAVIGCDDLRSSSVPSAVGKEIRKIEIDRLYHGPWLAACMTVEEDPTVATFAYGQRRVSIIVCRATGKPAVARAFHALEASQDRLDGTAHWEAIARMARTYTAESG